MLNISNKREQVHAFGDAYKELTVCTSTLCRLGNFKGALCVGGRLHRIIRTTRSRSFELRRHGPNQVSVRMKECIYHVFLTGMTAGGIFTKDSVSLLVMTVPPTSLPSYGERPHTSGNAFICYRFLPSHSREGMPPLMYALPKHASDSGNLK